MDASSINTKSSSKDYQIYERESSVRHSSINEPSKKRLRHKHHSDDHHEKHLFINNENNSG